jgi:Icc protein
MTSAWVEGFDLAVMPGIFYQPLDRRSFLRISAFGTAAVVSGCRTPPAPAPASISAGREFHLALLSDTHIPADRTNRYRGFNPGENLKRTVPEVVAAGPEGVIVNGDAARLEGLPGDYDEFKRLLEPVSAVSPVYISLGNHDHRANFFKAFPAPRGERQKVEGKHVLVIEHAVARIVMLDSLLYVNQAAGLLGKSQRQWLAGYLPQQADRPVVLFVHHTLKDGDGDLLDADRLFDLIRPHHQVKAIFYGHSHVWDLGERQGVKLINLPAVGYNFRDQDPVGWVDARFGSSGVQLKLHAFGGNIAENGRSVEIRWTA